jgi:ketosteroid isomerase-like protein
VSPENLAVIHRVYEAMNRQDVAALEELAELYPEYEWRNGADMPESQLRVGRESTIGYVRELFATFDQTHTTIREVDGRIAGLDEFLTLDEARAATAET